MRWQQQAFCVWAQICRQFMVREAKVAGVVGKEAVEVVALGWVAEEADSVEVVALGRAAEEADSAEVVALGRAAEEADSAEVVALGRVAEEADSAEVVAGPAAVGVGSMEALAAERAAEVVTSAAVAVVRVMAPGRVLVPLHAASIPRRKVSVGRGVPAPGRAPVWAARPSPAGNLTAA